VTSLLSYQFYKVNNLNQEKYAHEKEWVGVIN